MGWRIEGGTDLEYVMAREFGDLRSRQQGNPSPFNASALGSRDAAIPEHGTSVSMAARRDPDARLGSGHRGSLRRVHHDLRVGGDHLGAARTGGAHPEKSERPA